MSIWMAIVVTGKIVAAAGPLPGTMQDCVSKQQVFQSELAQGLSFLGAPPGAIPQVSFRCVQSSAPPKIRSRP